MARRLMLFWLLIGVAIGRQLPMRMFGISNGLNRDVQCMVRDSQGYLWFCTTGGLSLFDGLHFSTYGKEDGLPSDGVFDFAEGPNGRRWVATNRGLAEFRPSDTPRFFAHLLPGPAPSSVRKLLVDHDGRLWVGTSEGLFREAGRGFETVELPAPEMYAGREIRGLRMDRFGALWIAARSGLYRHWPNGRVERYTVNDGLLSDNVESLLEDRTGMLWAGTRSGLCWLSNTAVHAKIEGCISSAPGLPDHAIWALFQGSDGRIWVGTDHGVAQIHPGTPGKRPAFSSIPQESGLRDACISLSEDPAGNLWIGTEAGAVRLATQGFSLYTAEDGLADASVLSVFANRDGQVQAITRKHKVFLYGVSGERLQQIRPAFPLLENEGWTTGQIALQSRSREWWFITGSGLLRFPPAPGGGLAALHLKARYGKAEGLAGDATTIVYEDSRGDVWFQSMGLAQVGWHRWNAATDTLTSFQAHDFGMEVASDLLAMTEDATGYLWFGFRSGKIVGYRDGQFRFIGPEHGVPTGGIRCLFADRNEGLWAGSSESGLLRIQGAAQGQPRVTVYGRSQGLGGNNVSAIVDDQWGRIYAANGSGIDRVDPATRRIEHFGTAEGFGAELVNQAMRDNKGTLWFATSRGLARFDPTPPAVQHTPPVRIHAIRVRGVAYPISDLGQSAASLPDLAYYQNQVQIDFTAPNFDPGEVVMYQWRLFGADPEWSAPSNFRTVNYASLGPGRYHFQVRSWLAGSDSPSPAATVELLILSPIWARWWFRLALAMLLGVAAYGIHRYRVRQILAVEAVRARIAADLHDDIGASLSQISILSEIVRSRLDGAASSVAGPLNDIGAISSAVMDSMSDMVWAIHPKHDRLSDLVHRVRWFAGEMLGARDIALEFQPPEAGDDPILGAEFRRHVLLIAKEALNNIARHSGASRTEIRFSIETGIVSLLIRDNGCGFDENACRQGNGLWNMRRRATQLGGSMELSSQPGAGTELRITVRLNLPKLGGRASKV